MRLHSHSRGDLVLEGVGWDPVGAFEEDWFPIDAEIKAQAWRAGDWLLDKFHCAKKYLQEAFYQELKQLKDLLKKRKNKAAASLCVRTRSSNQDTMSEQLNKRSEESLQK